MQSDSRKSIGPRRSEASAEAILKAAEELLAEQGLGSFSIEAVARRAKAGKTTIYRWWPNRTALLLAVYHKQKREIEYRDSTDLRENVLTFLRHLFAFWRDTPAGNIFKSIIAEAQASEQASQQLEKYALERRKQIMEMLKLSGEAVETAVAAELIMGFAWVRLLTNRLDFDEGELSRAVDVLMQGMHSAKADNCE